MSTSLAMIQSASLVDSDGVVRCYHGERLEVLTSTSANNPGRKFYTCFKKRGDPDKCNFFKWVDELPQSSISAAAGSNVSHPKTPSKRLRPPTPPTSKLSPSKTATKSSYNLFDPIVDDDDDCVNLVSDEEISQFLGRRSQDKPPAKKCKIHRTEEIHENATPWGLTKTKPLSLSPTRRPTQKTSQWEAICYDQENPFHVRDPPIAQAQSSKLPLSQPLTSPNTSQVTGVTGDSIKQAWEFWSAVPEAYCKLERKLIAAEKARDAKAARIAMLEKEIQDLKGRNLSLEKAMETLEANNEQ